MESVEPRVDRDPCTDLKGMLATLSLHKDSNTYPPHPSFAVIVLIPCRVPENAGGIVVCIRTLTASKGHSPTSAMNSAEAEALKNSRVLYLVAFSSPANWEYRCLKYS